MHTQLEKKAIAVSARKHGMQTYDVVVVATRWRGSVACARAHESDECTSSPVVHLCLHKWYYHDDGAVCVCALY